MSHHQTASPTNPTGAVEVVRVSSSAATTAPVDTGGATGTPATPASTVVNGQSGTPGATLPVEDLQQASNTIQGAQADLSVTAGAERRLDGFDGVGGGGGGGGDGQANANNAEGAVAQGTADMDVSESGVGGARDMGEQTITTTADAAGTADTLPQTDTRSATV
jgi:hypothetical protein